MNLTDYENLTLQQWATMIDKDKTKIVVMQQKAPLLYSYYREVVNSDKLRHYVM